MHCYCWLDLAISSVSGRVALPQSNCFRWNIHRWCHDMLHILIMCELRYIAPFNEQELAKTAEG